MKNSPNVSIPDMLSEIDAATTVYELRFLWFSARSHYWDFCLVDYKRVAEAISAQYFYLEALKILNKNNQPK